MAGRITGLQRTPPDFLLFSSGRQINLGEMVVFGEERPVREKPAVAGESRTKEPDAAVVVEVGRIMDRMIGLDGYQIM